MITQVVKWKFTNAIEKMFWGLGSLFAVLSNFMLDNFCLGKASLSFVHIQSTSQNYSLKCDFRGDSNPCAKKKCFNGKCAMGCTTEAQYDNH